MDLSGVDSSCHILLSSASAAGGSGRPGSGENQAAPSEAPIRLERAGHPQRPYREFPGK
jgi:hypothetical protein